MTLVLFTKEPNEEIKLFSANFGIKQDGIDVWSGKGDLILKWLPLPAYWFNLVSETEVIKAGQVRLTNLLQKAISAKAFSPKKTDGGFSCLGYISNDSFDEGGLIFGSNQEKCDGVIFHIVNFFQFRTTENEISPIQIRYLDQDGSDWQIIIKPATNITDVTKKLNEEAFGGYAVTHVGILRRNDGINFEFSRATSLLAPLRDLLTLMRGGWCYPLLIIGLKDTNHVCYSLWEPRFMSWIGRFSWCNLIEVIQINRMYAAFAEKFHEERLYTRINNAIGLYVDANQAINVHTGIIAAQAALELLSWLYADIFEESALSYAKKFVYKKDKSFEKLSADHKIRWMLKEICHIPTEIPDGADAVIDHIKNSKGSREDVDGPEAITYIRNGIIHPSKEKMKRGFEAKLPALINILDLECKYVELILLNLMKYDGDYMDRFSKQLHRVPWAAKQ